MKRFRPDSPVAAVSALLVDEGRVLLIRRHAEPNRGRWSFPGGTVELGEALRDAVVREVREETGLAVQPLAVVDAVDVLVPPAGRPDYHFVLIVFAAKVVGGTLTPQSDAAEARWVPFGELGDMDVTDTTRRTIETVRSQGHM